MLSITEIRIASVSVTLFLVLGSSVVGCHWNRPVRTAADVRTLGSVLDDVNRAQEESAEAAKFTIYMHEFQINASPIEDAQPGPGFAVENQGPSGYQLTPAGKDHVREIARQMLQMDVDGQTGLPPNFLVIVERSDTSKSANTVYQYPVNHNPQLDAIRRQMVVSALQRLGVSWADPCVIVAPAFATGLSATESAAAYQRATGVGLNSGGSGSRNSGGSRYRP